MEGTGGARSSRIANGVMLFRTDSMPRLCKATVGSSEIAVEEFEVSNNTF
jgi:hypothetical protein